MKKILLVTVCLLFGLPMSAQTHEEHKISMTITENIFDRDITYDIFVKTNYKQGNPIKDEIFIQRKVFDKNNNELLEHQYIQKLNTFNVKCICYEEITDVNFYADTAELIVDFLIKGEKITTKYKLKDYKFEFMGIGGPGGVACSGWNYEN